MRLHLTTLQKWSIPGVLATIVFLALSCASTPETSNGSPQTSGDKPIVRGIAENPDKLQSQEFLSVTLPVSNPRYLSCSAWSKAKILSSVLSSLKLHEELSREKKFELLSYLIDELPVNAPDGLVRQVYVGQFFENKSPLEIRIGVFTPGKDATIKSDKILVFMSNALLGKDGEILRGGGKIIDLDANASVLMILVGDQVADTEFLTNKPDPSWEEIEKMSSFEKVFLAQRFIQDANPANDANAEKICQSILAKGDSEPAVTIMAMLMMYNASLAKENIPAAEQWWAKILEFSPKVPGDMTPANLETMNGTDLYIMKRLLGKASS
ncbi:hypothetical protein [Treponema sp. J25]|uniref:hypothetical protein n=1 Tax=Treponema sp. J25 TaxID=2094121 RepID=UPI0010481D8C|nr:hypothetical protein [Treponema sp. J25]TCW61580.1 hypothetical protein C5O22_05805 [Treponema sp. J25]